jgi:hypothetical protein
MMSPLVEQIFHQIDRLSLVEQVQVLEQLALKIEHSASGESRPLKHQVSDFYGKAPNLLAGVDARSWVNDLRDEWEKREWSQFSLDRAMEGLADDCLPEYTEKDLKEKW